MSNHYLYNADSRYLSDFIDENSVDLIVTSPPYNLEKEYEKEGDDGTKLAVHGSFPLDC